MRKKLNEKLLKKLEITLLSVNVVLNDAEGKQIRNASVKKWLDELEDAAYDAEDLLDEIYNEVKSSTTNEVRNLNSDSLSLYEKELEQNIEDILERLEFIAKQKDILCLKEDAGIKVLSPRTPTSSLVKGCDVYGRHDDKEVIVDLLLSDDASGNKIDVIPIVGMGGIGKTTLAQFVYNDGRVKEKFDLRAWLCVSEEFDIFKITRTVLEVVSSTVCDIKDLDSLQLDLKEKLSGKRFLFVLDDVWNENYVDWCLLRSPFQYGAQGSKIIVTTRSGQVASIMQTVPSHYLGHLSNEDSWKLFAKHAFDYRDQTAHPVLEEIGRGIVKKCKGLPLAAKTLGGLLRLKLMRGNGAKY
ncbi:NB-LRR disease resistance protein [Quillaja saponaria]|uniref:NB-LRR disease resistance protein n=1 Tax=Quillaja saponaria TaxID=32244 RepID=A0AAD7L0X0_QUISA|nr:NB-LRR disease resistance protein [Quillaja saponaria]